MPQNCFTFLVLTIVQTINLCVYINGKKKVYFLVYYLVEKLVKVRLVCEQQYKKWEAVSLKNISLTNAAPRAIEQY